MARDRHTLPIGTCQAAALHDVLAHAQVGDLGNQEALILQQHVLALQVKVHDLPGRRRVSMKLCMQVLTFGCRRLVLRWRQTWYLHVGPRHASTWAVITRQHTQRVAVIVSRRWPSKHTFVSPTYRLSCSSITTCGSRQTRIFGVQERVSPSKRIVCYTLQRTPPQMMSSCKHADKAGKGRATDYASTSCPAGPSLVIQHFLLMSDQQDSEHSTARATVWRQHRPRSLQTACSGSSQPLRECRMLH